MLDEDLKKKCGNDDALFETLLTFYHLHYPTEPERLLSLYTRNKVEKDVMPEIEEIHLSTKPSSRDTATSSVRSVLFRSEKDVFFSFCNKNECAADKFHNENITKNKL